MDRFIDDGCIKTQRSMVNWFKKAAFISVIFAMVLVAAVGTASAALPTLLFLQGKITDTNGVPVSSGDITVEIYNVSTGGSAIFTETHTSAISEGFFDVLVGSVTTLNLDFNDEYYMEVYVGATEVIGDGVNNRINFTASGGEIEGEDIAIGTITATKLADDYVDVTGDTMTGALTLPSNGLTVGTNQLVVSGGNVGIGTASPGARLHIENAGHTYQSIYSSIASQEAGLQLRDAGSNGWQLTKRTNNDFGIFDFDGTGGSGWRFLIDNSGNVGIGVESPGEKLEVDGNINVTSGNDICIDGGNCLSTAGGGIGGSGTDNYIPRWSGTSDLEDSVIYQTDGGSVGIGTTGPSRKLDVNGDLGANNIYAAANVLVSNSVMGNGDTDTLMNFAGDYLLFNAGGLSLLELRETTQDYVKLGNAAGDVDIELNDDIFVEGSSGNVGIGTTSPSAKLDVEVSSGGAATIGSSLNSATGDYAVAMGYGTNASSPYSIALGYWTTASGPYSTAMGSSTTASGSSSTAMGRQTTASGLYSTALGREIEAQGDYSVAIALNDQNGAVVSQPNTMAIMGGNVGIGTTTPLSKLSVGGPGSSNIGIYSTGSNYGVYGNGAWYGLYGYAYAPDSNTKYGVFSYARSYGTGGAQAIRGYVYRGGSGVHWSGYFLDGGTGGTYNGLYADERTGGAIDLAEYIKDTFNQTEAADVVIADPDNDESVIKSYKPFDTTVLGIVSTRPHLTMGMELVMNESTGEMYEGVNATKLAVAGRVPVKVTDENGPIKRGDLLTTSSTPGYAMKWTLLEPKDAENFEELKDILSENEERRNAVLGKALEPLESGEGKIVALVTLQ